MFYLILLIIICLFIAALLIFLSGLFIVKENHVAIFEKMYNFLTFKTKGVYFFTPFLVRRVGYYSTENEYIKLQIKEKQIYIVYRIDDFVKYHYSGHCFKEMIFDTLNKVDEYEKAICDFADKNGIKILDLKIK